MTVPDRHSILIVEDEPLLRVDTVDMVEDEEFTAHEAASADAALRFLESNSDITVMCTDIDMPGPMDGLGLAMEVRKRWPNIAIVVVSVHHRPTQDDIPYEGRFVPKPYVKAAIMRALKETIKNTPQTDSLIENQ